jgi:hypothetical protein
MKVSIPPRFGVSVAAGAATFVAQRDTIQRAAPRPTAANPNLLIICFLPFHSSHSFIFVIGMDS